MSKLFVLTQFNNYYNRKIKKFNNIQDYRDYMMVIMDNYDFKIEDGINTRVKIKTDKEISGEQFIINSIPDYLVVTDDNNQITSRWFILEWIEKRGALYEATLRRDVIADNYESIIDAPVFIEKATIEDVKDVALFNNEGMSFNQIKKSETPLIDESKCSWIVGYVPTNALKDEHGDPIEITVTYNDYVYTFTPLQDHYGNDIPDFDDMPFRMFAIPYKDVDCYTKDALDVITTYSIKKDVAVAIATGIAKFVGSGNIYDVQLVPYCPLRRKLISGAYACDFTPELDTPTNESLGIVGKYELKDSTYYQLIYNDQGSANTNVDAILCWAKLNKFSFDIDYSIPFPSKALDIKVKNETEIYRLCSPNFNGQFEFNPMKNKGVTKFNIDVMYQPFNPYIHINPDFYGLYGDDFDDARGLICGGDFSLPQETSAWANYVQNNKNYQQIFDRSIQNMEVNNELARLQAGAQILTGTLQGAAAGAYLGSGTGIGAGVGAAVGGAASLAGGIVDYAILKDQQKETLDYTKDLFGYNMQNIRAMPNSISKTNPFTNNNKIFPILEKYSATDTEIEALKNKLKYNGMSIGRIGKIKDWLLDDYSYIKGQLIMLDIEEEYHAVLEIAEEINKGIRIRKEVEE